MLGKLKKLQHGTSSILIYCNSPSLELLLKRKLKQRFGVSKDFDVSLKSVKDIKRAKVDALMSPLTGGKWMLNIDVDDLDRKELVEATALTSVFGVNVYWTSNYGTYKFLDGLDTFEKQGNYFSSLYMGRLDVEDIDLLYSDLVSDKKKEDEKEIELHKKLMGFLFKNYKNEPQSIFDLFMMMKSGNEVKSTKDIVTLIGIGGSSVDSVLFWLLTTSKKDMKGVKSVFKKVIRSLDDLSVTYDYNTMRNFMLSTLDGIVEVKELQIMGKYNAYVLDIPKNFDEKKIKRLKRYESIIFDKVTLVRAISLRSYIKAFDDFNSELALLRAFAYYLTGVMSKEGVNKS